jgi:hypothetical protein
MSDVDKLLAVIDAEERKFGETIQLPASPEAIERLRRFARDSLRTDLPEGYVTFLGRTDGLVFNGYEIFAATQHKKPYQPGLSKPTRSLARRTTGTYSMEEAASTSTRRIGRAGRGSH